VWQAAKRDLMAKHPFKRLIAELPLCSRILALVALAIALARPAVRGGKIQGDHVAIVVDTSASMGNALRRGARPRLTEAQRVATDVVSALAAGGRRDRDRGGA